MLYFIFRLTKMSFYYKLALIPLFHVVKIYMNNAWKLYLWSSLLLILTINRLNRVFNKFTKEQEEKIEDLLNESHIDKFTELVFRNAKHLSLLCQFLELVSQIGVFYVFPNFSLTWAIHGCINLLL